MVRWADVPILVCKQPLRPTQLPTLCGMRNGYRPKVSGLWLGIKVTVGLAVRHTICAISSDVRFHEILSA